MSFTWNHRMVRDLDEDPDLIMLQEVCYNSKGEPYGFSDAFMCSETVEGMQELAQRIAKAAAQPVLVYPTDFGKGDDDDEAVALTDAFQKAADAVIADE
jgi:hypothetical protein